MPILTDGPMFLENVVALPVDYVSQSAVADGDISGGGGGTQFHGRPAAAAEAVIE